MDENVLARLKSFGAFTVQLNENFRNPKNIVNEMCAVTGAYKSIRRRELPSNVEYRAYANEKEQAKKLRALLVELLRAGVQPRHITVLSAKSKDHACVILYPPDIGKPIYFLDSESSQCPEDVVTAATISGFKGLENELIILSDLPSSAPLSDWARSVFYVDMTRPRTKLFALVDRMFLEARGQV
jgi:hypothetical protein